MDSVVEDSVVEKEKVADSAVAADLEAAGSARPNPSESFYMSQDLHSQTR